MSNSGSNILFSGFSYEDIIKHVVNYVGNTSPEFETYVRDLVIMAEHRYLKMHDWTFTFKTGMRLEINSVDDEYSLDYDTIGYFVNAADVENVRSETRYLLKVDLNELRRLDSGVYDQRTNVEPRYWSVIGENKIYLWPPNRKPQQLIIDGKISPTTLINENTQQLVGNPTIPMMYQEGFIEYIKALALDRENDDRAQSKKVEAMQLIRLDIQDDMRNLGDGANPRIKSIFELPGETLSPEIVPPQPPTNITGTPGNGEITISWLAPVNNGGGVISDYLIQYAVSSSTPNWIIFTDSISDLTTATVTGLNAGTLYIFRAAAVNSAGPSDYSDPSPPISTLAIPNPPTNIVPTIGNTQVTLSWSAPVIPVTDYIIQYAVASSTPSWILFNDAVSTNTTATVTNLLNGIPYIFRVASKNEIGVSNYSNPTPSSTPAALPNAPTNVVLTSTGGWNLYTEAGSETLSFDYDTISVSWVAPLNTGGLPIINYRIYISSNNGTTYTEFSQPPSTLTTFALASPAAGIYRFKIAAVTAAGTGAESVPSNSVDATPITITTTPRTPLVVVTSPNSTVILPVTELETTATIDFVEYQWQKKEKGAASFVDIPGAIFPNLTLTNVTNATDDGDEYRQIIVIPDCPFFLTSTATKLNILSSVLWVTGTAVQVRARSIDWSKTLGIFCAIGDGVCVRSGNGTSWLVTNNNNLSYASGICWSEERQIFVAVRTQGVQTNQIMTSPDGINWTFRTSPFGSGVSWQDVCWSPELGLFCAIFPTAANNGAVTSPDGVTWTARTTPTGSYSWKSICWSPTLNMFCAVSANQGAVMTSTNGINWTLRAGLPGVDLKDVCWASDLNMFCAVGANNTIATSTDGNTWTVRRSGGNDIWTSVIRGAEIGKFVVLGTGPTYYVLSSNDGISWDVIDVPPVNGGYSSAQLWDSVCWSPERRQFLGVTSSTEVYLLGNAV